MQIDIQHPAFNLQHLSVETAGLFNEPMLLLNGAILKRQNGFYRAISDTGTETTIGVIYNYFSRSLKLVIIDLAIDLPTQFKWYELDCPVH